MSTEQHAPPPVHEPGTPVAPEPWISAAGAESIDLAVQRFVRQAAWARVTRELAQIEAELAEIDAPWAAMEAAAAAEEPPFP